MLRIPILITIILLLTHNGHTQYGFGTNTPNSNAVVHFTSSDSTKGVLLPVTTTAKLPIAANALKGMVVYNLDENCFQLCNGTNWKCLTINDSSEWVDGSLVGLTAGNIYARQSLTRGDTVTIDTNGKFGIGTNTPLQNLEVSGTGTVVAHVMTKDSTASDRAVFGIKRGTKLWDLGINTQLNNNNNLNFREGAIIRFTMAEGGNVGVGTNAPTFRLDVDSAINAGYHYYQKGERIVTAIPNNTAIASGNVAVGVNTLRNVSGILNTAVGNLTLDSNTTGNLNTAIGASSLRSNLTGSFNTGVGYNTLTSNSSGDDNTAMGRSALSQNTIGDSNTAVGVVSLGDNINGRLNVALGTGALANNISGNGNTSVGTDALRSSLNGNNNIAIGVDAGDNLSAGDNNIIIGSNIDFPSNTNSYQLNIGNIIYGTDIDGSGSTLSTGNIGIGTTTPSAKLDVENIVDGDTSEITTELNTYTTGATLTQNRSHTPLSITYTANNVVGAQTNGQRHTVLGINSRVTASGTTRGYSYSSLFGRTIHNSSGDMTDMFGSYSLAETQNAATSSGNIDNLRGIYGGATINSGSTGVVNSAVGVRANALNNNNNNTLNNLTGTSSQANNDNGGTVINAYGSNNLVFNNDASTISNAYGNYSRIIQDDAGGTINNSYGYYSYIDHDAGTSTNGYLFRGDYDGIHTNKWGIYLTGEDSSYLSGSLGIGTTNITEKLDVNGNIRASGNFISGATTLTVPDYVFEKYYKGESKLKKDYTFLSLEEIESFTRENGHLPGVTSAGEVKSKNQFNITQSSLTNLEKIEELYLHVIEVNKSNKSLIEQNKKQQELINLLLEQNQSLNKRVEALENKE